MPQLINEIVVQPQRDWDDSGPGGNVTPFDATPGTATAPDAAVTAADQWVEIITQTGTPRELANFTLEFVNVAGTPVSLTLTAANMRTVAGSPYIVVGAPPGGIAPTSVITLRDTLKNVVDSVDLATLTTQLGPATGTANEAIARDPDGARAIPLTSCARRRPSGPPTPRVP